MRQRWSRGCISAGVFTVLYSLAAAAGAVVTGNMEFVMYVVIMAIMAGLLLWTHLVLTLPAGLLWCLSAWGALHMAGGLVHVPDSWPTNGTPVLYNWWIIPDSGEGGGWLKYDQVIHAYGFGITAWLCWDILRSLVRRHSEHRLRPTFGVLVLVASASCGFGALNEIIEFIATRVTETNVGGYVNTGLDLIANATGAIVACVVIRIVDDRMQRRHFVAD